jgi:hypothetical protein
MLTISNKKRDEFVGSFKDCFMKKQFSFMTHGREQFRILIERTFHHTHPILMFKYIAEQFKARFNSYSEQLSNSNERIKTIGMSNFKGLYKDIQTANSFMYRLMDYTDAPVTAMLIHDAMTKIINLGLYEKVLEPDNISTLCSLTISLLKRTHLIQYDCDTPLYSDPLRKEATEAIIDFYAAVILCMNIDSEEHNSELGSRLYRDGVDAILNNNDDKSFDYSKTCPLIMREIRSIPEKNVKSITLPDVSDISDYNTDDVPDTKLVPSISSFIHVDEPTSRNVFTANSIGLDSLAEACHIDPSFEINESVLGKALMRDIQFNKIYSNDGLTNRLIFEYGGKDYLAIGDSNSNSVLYGLTLENSEGANNYIKIEFGERSNYKYQYDDLILQNA